MRLSKLIILLSLFSMGCGNQSVLEGFNDKEWKEDAMGCNANRKGLIDDLMLRKADLQGMGQTEISSTLGDPDRHELYSRNKKAFVYFISPGPECEQSVENPAKLIIRFDGLRRAKEIIYYKE